jgi:hypothetical protein
LRFVEETLEREGLGDRVLSEAAIRASELVDPISDFHASGAYRRRLTRVLVGRALTPATAMARRIEKTDGSAEKDSDQDKRREARGIGRITPPAGGLLA